MRPHPCCTPWPIPTGSRTDGYSATLSFRGERSESPESTTTNIARRGETLLAPSQEVVFMDSGLGSGEPPRNDSGRGLARCALGEDALQGPAVHVEAPRRLGDVAPAQLVDPLDVLPADPVRRHGIFRRQRPFTGL